MRVIAPRRSSTSAAGSGSLYGTSSAGTSGDSSTSGSHHISSSSSTTTGSGAVDRSSGGATTNGYSRYSSSYDRGSSLSKWLPTSSGGSSSSGYGSSYYPSSYSTYSANSSSSSSYAPRSSLQRSSVGSTSSSSYLSGGSGTSSSAYRTTSSYLSSSSYDSPTYSRYGLPRKSASKTTTTTNGDSLTRSSNREDYGLRRGQDSAKKPPISGGSGGHSISNSRDAQGDGSKRLSSSSSSPSLARLVATSGLDIYEKYSPANYKPNCELSRSRSGHSEAELENGGNKETTPTCTVTLERPRSSSSRYSRLYSNSSDAGGDSSAGSTGRLGSGKYSINSSSSSGDVPTATFTLRSNRTRRSQAEAPMTTPVESAAAPPAAPPPPPPPPPPTNGHKAGESNGELGAKLNGLSLLSTSPKRNAIYERNQDTTDDAGVCQDSADNADVSTSATFKLNDSSKLNSCRLRSF
ncbi:sericin 1 isoform X5 [Drosophila takahashii]|uniref:sericin 1 isoform X5 n=1 Tax=Drosophila takahashii TaxID=29030 RepID=UPI001CF84DEC|nr:uncharacterized protein DDB_G0271670 isoform X4 [Drosophila takahashii]